MELLKVPRTLLSDSGSIPISEGLSRLCSLWERLSRDAAGQALPVRLMTQGTAGKRVSIRGLPGAFAEPMFVEDKMWLVVIYERLARLTSLSSEDEHIIAHEVGHWILNAQGYKGVALYGPDGTQIQDEEMLLIDALVNHVPLAELMSEHGFYPRVMYNPRLEGLKKRLKKGHRIESPLLYADTIRFADKQKTDHFMRLLRKRDKEAADEVKKLNGILKDYDLNDPESSLAAIMKLVSYIKHGAKLVVQDNIELLKEHCKRASLTENGLRPG